MRVGGATALRGGTQGNATLVRRLGRWASDAVHSYLWDLPVLTEGTTEAMVNADTAVPWGADLHHAAEVRHELERLDALTNGEVVTPERVRGEVRQRRVELAVIRSVHATDRTLAHLRASRMAGSRMHRG